MSKPFSRRAFLRGSAGAMLALPIFEFMLNSSGTAYADGTPLPKVFGTYFWGVGMSAIDWNPVGTGPTWTIKTDAAISGDNSPLSNFQTRGLKPYMNLGKNFSVYATVAAGGDGHWPYNSLILTGKQRIKNGNMYGGKTIDYLIRDALYPGQNGRILDLILSTSATPMNGDPTMGGTRSYNGTTVNMPTWKPAEAYDRIFGNFTPPPPGSPESFRARRRKAVIDSVHADAGKFRQKLGATDKARLDAHLATVSDLGKRVAGNITPPSSCTVPARPTGPYALPAQHYQVYDEPAVQINDLMTDVLVAGMACGAVPVFSYSYSGATGGHFHGDVPANVALGPIYYGTQGATLDMAGYHNELSHYNTNAWVNPPSNEQIRRAYNDCNRSIMNHLAVLGEKMKNTAIGSTNLLAQSLVFATSEHGAAHDPLDMPILLLGSAGGTIKSPGVMAVGGARQRSANYEQRNGGRNANDVLVTLMHAMGVVNPTIGEDENIATSQHLVTEFLT